MKKFLSLIIALFIAAILVSPVFAAPQFNKHVAPIFNADYTLAGVAIYNDNPTIDGYFEVEIEFEECLALAATQLNQNGLLEIIRYGSFDDLSFQITFDGIGNGKATIYVPEPPSNGDDFTIDNTALTMGYFVIATKPSK